MSFPATLAITPMQCEAWNPNTGKYGPSTTAKTKSRGSKMVYTETKLNSAYSFGGPKCLVKEIQKLSGLSINHFIAVDFAGFAKMVEALGGVEVCSKTPLHDYELGTVPGTLRTPSHRWANGVELRPRTPGPPPNSTATTAVSNASNCSCRRCYVRSSPRTHWTNLGKLNNVVNLVIGNTYVDNIKTKDLVQLGQSLQSTAAGHFTFVTVPTGVTDQNGDEPPRTADMRALFDAIINDDPLPMENDQKRPELDHAEIQHAHHQEGTAAQRGARGSAPAGDNGVTGRRDRACVQRDEPVRPRRDGVQPAQAGTVSM